MRISHRLIKYLKFKNVLIDFNIRLENANESVSEPGVRCWEVKTSSAFIVVWPWASYATSAEASSVNDENNGIYLLGWLRAMPPLDLGSRGLSPRLLRLEASFWPSSGHWKGGLWGRMEGGPCISPSRPHSRYPLRSWPLKCTPIGWGRGQRAAVCRG